MNSLINWLSSPENLTLVKTLVIFFALIINACGFFLAALAFRQNRKVHFLSFPTNLTASHRDIWKLSYDSPELKRVTKENPDLLAQPITDKEEQLVNLVVLNMILAFEADRLGVYPLPEGSKRDAISFLQLPIPQRVWKDIREYQPPQFVEFIERLREQSKD
jgi:hypothetical protein